MQDLRSLIENFNAQDEKKATENYRFMEEQKIKKSLAPRLWEDLKRGFSQHCDEIRKSSSRNLVAKNEGIYVLSILDKKSGREALLKYDANVPCVHYDTPSEKGEFTFRVSPDGNSLDFLVLGIPHSIEQIVMITVSHVTG
jgi:hypothetical protein